MNISNEAAYLYVYSKELEKINSKIKRLSKKAEKHKKKHDNAREHKKPKHKAKHSNVIGNIKDLMRRHNKLVTQLRRHQIAFAGALTKEHKI